MFTEKIIQDSSEKLEVAEQLDLKTRTNLWDAYSVFKETLATRLSQHVLVPTYYRVLLAGISRLLPWTLQHRGWAALPQEVLFHIIQPFWLHGPIYPFRFFLAPFGLSPGFLVSWLSPSLHLIPHMALLSLAMLTLDSPRCLCPCLRLFAQ